MKQSRTLIYAVTAASLLTVGSIGVRAAPTCERVIKVYREKIIHHHVSKETANRWAVWAKAHPKYHPKPKPALGSEEVLKKIAVACEVPVGSPDFSDLLATTEQTLMLTTEEAPVYLADATPDFTLIGTPVVPTPVTPTDDIPTPEPSTFILLGSALALLAFFKRNSLLQTSNADSLSSL